ncbi:MAG: hypothetical protein WAM82_23875 [Thermoanaerobaculia bacterium]
MFPKGRKLLAVLTLVGLFVLSGPAARAGGGPPNRMVRTAQEVRAPEAFFAWAWLWVRSLWEKNGPCIDPDGRCLQSTGSTSSSTDRGACIDPNGQCANLDAGPHIDPDG